MSMDMEEALECITHNTQSYTMDHNHGMHHGEQQFQLIYLLRRALVICDPLQKQWKAFIHLIKFYK